ncbi:asparaginase [Georgenia yuyongxinii]|uniref:Asparaginase n=1 Tax=Georgenia yuyongxinii TaxID=2589797 RepID=A0A5B8C4X6_9MICO|nr:asparaginase [Georgenia yuyongxinii]QDC25644.1 asparaginase [Georgenia yuyongxinii]
MTGLWTVEVIGLGGTIAMPRSDDGGGGAVPSLTAEDLAAATPGLLDVADLNVSTPHLLPGASLTFELLRDVTAQARQAVDGGAAGVVLTQGTDTIEETAYLLDLLWDRDQPLVVTGAMRPPGTAGADGPGNLLAAVAVAVAPESRRRGVLVVFGDEVHAARRVAKVHSSRLAAFASPAAGPVGGVTEGIVRYWSPPPARRSTLTVGNGPAPAVALVPAVLGDTGAALRATAAASEGVVLAAMGGGHVPAAMVDALAAVVAAKPLAAATRTGAGPLLRDTYGFPGSERDLHRLGVLDAGDLPPLKARILLTAVMWAHGARAEQEAAFRRGADV